VINLKVKRIADTSKKAITASGQADRFDDVDRPAAGQGV
jgi:hypothetical protein